MVARLSPTPVDRPPAPTPVSALRVSRTAEPKPPPSEPETPPAPTRADPPTVVKVEPAKGRDLSLVNPSETSASKVFQEAKNRGDQPAADFEIPRKFIDHKTKAPKYQSKRPTPQPQPQPQPTRVARAPTPAPAVDTGDAAEAMALYEAGDLDGAIAAARSVGNNGLANKIASFKKEIATAKADLSFKDGAGAIKHYTSALTVDDELSKGWGKLGGQIRVELSKLYQIAGMQAVEKGDNAKAVVHLEKALKYDPDNEKAKSLLQKVKSSGPGSGSSAAPAGKPADARSAADQAFGE